MERRGVGHGFRCKGETGCIFIHLWGEGKGHSDGGVGCKWEKMVGRLAMVMRDWMGLAGIEAPVTMQ